MIPALRKPPMAPTKMISVGTSTPRPSRRGLRILSTGATRMAQIRNPTAVTVSAVENR
jgi:hypothetical protein